MTDEERHREITETRQFYIGAPVILPLIQQRKRVAFERLMSKHKEGATDYLALVAELNVLNDLEREIIGKEQTYRALEEKNGKSNR